MNFQTELRCRARKYSGTIILPEADDLRILEGASSAIREELARIVLIGEEKSIRERAGKARIDLEGARFLSLRDNPLKEDFATRLAERRAHRGLTLEKARELMETPLWFGAMTVAAGGADGMVAGAATSSADVFHAALQTIGPGPGTEVVSVAGFIEIPRCSLGDKGLFLFADCVVAEDPSASQLASIALSAAQTWKALRSSPPRIAMISYSTKGSAQSPMVEKVREATGLVRERRSSLIVDGELQFDAAVAPEVARTKAPGSPVEGKANILVFPDLNSANSNFKNAEILAGGVFRASVVQGLAKPINDLSRGTTAETVADTIAVTVLQAEALHA